MKKIFKFIPAALAVLAMASCSNDMLLGDKTQQQDVANKGDLRISWDAFDGQSGTRAMRDADGKHLTFANTDMVNVYDESLYATDVYEFQDDAFYYASTGDPMVSEPKFAIMRGATVKDPKGYTDRASRKTCVDIEIPRVITYDVDSERKLEDGTKVYACDLPAFGYASLNPEGYVEVKNLRYMTAILQVHLTKAVGNASFLRLSNTAGKSLSGILTATLESDPEQRENVALDDEHDPDLTVYDNLYVDLTGVSSNESYIYIPVVAGLDGDLDGIKLEYTNNRNISDVASELDDNGTPIVWLNTGMEFPNKKFKQNKLYKGSAEFEFEDMNPKLISDILAQYVGTEEDIDINITKTFNIDDSDPDVHNVIKLPKFENDVNVNITLDENFNTWALAAGSDALTIEDLDEDDPFTGTITINAGDVINGQTANDVDINIELAEGTAIIAGEFNNDQQLNPIGGNIQLGDGETTTKGFIITGKIGDDVKSFTIAKEAEMASDLDCTGIVENQTKTIIIAGKLTGDILTSPSPTEEDATTVTVSGEVTGSITATATDAFTSVYVSGIVGTNINLPGAVKGEISITSGDPEVDAPDAIYVGGNVTMKGDVEVALANEGEAIAGTLTMTGSGKTLKLVQGYIKEISVNVANAGSWENKYIDVVLNDANEGLAGFKTLTEAPDNEARFTESVWDGNKITNATYTSQATTHNGDLCFYTASQFASMTSIGGNRYLCNDINLNNKPWSAYQQKAIFEGVKVVAKDVEKTKRQYPVIKNLNLKKKEATETEYANGLFLRNSAASTVKNITIDGVTADFAVKKTLGIGAIYGYTTFDATFENVIIKGINIKNTKEMSGVGGLVGIANATITATSAKVAGTIDGYSRLGGFVGSNGNFTSIFDKCDASGIAFKQTYDSGKKMDLNYAMIGGFIGSTENYVESTNGVAPASINFDKTAKMYRSSDSETVGNFFNYNAEQNYIGFSAEDDLTARLDGKNYCNHGWNGITAKSHNHGTVKYFYLCTWPEQ